MEFDVELRVHQGSKLRSPTMIVLGAAAAVTHAATALVLKLLVCTCMVMAS